MKPWDKFQHEKLSKMGRTCESVINFGAWARKDKSYFKKGQAVVCDIDPSVKPDILGNLCDLNCVQSEMFDGIICFGVLEHVENPFLAEKEMYRILKPNGKLYGYVPFLSAYHGKPGHYPDNYRYSEDGVKCLLKKYRDLEITPVYGNVTSWLNQLPGKLHIIKSAFYWSDRFFSNRQVSGYYFFGRK